MSRTRSSTLINTPSGDLYWRGYDKNGTLMSTYVSSHTHSKTKSIVDNLTPDFYGKLARGEFLPINTVTISTVETKTTSVHSGTLSHVNPASLSSGVTAYYTGNMAWFTTGAVLPAYTINQSDIDACVIKAMASAKEPDWDVLTFIGEFPQTVKLIGKRIRGVNRIARRVARRASRREVRRSGRSRTDYDPRRALDDFTSLWLEARYGWRPLVYDVQSMLKALKHKSENSIRRKSARVTVPVTASAGPSVTGNAQVKYTLTRQRAGSTRIRAVVFYKGDMSAIGANPVVTAWELTRFSFVVDWFVNVGAWIQAISPRVGYDQLGVSISTVSDYYETTQQSMTGGSSNWSASMADHVQLKFIQTYNRQTYTGIPLPSIQVNLNPLKVIDLIALALQGRSDVMKILRL